MMGPPVPRVLAGPGAPADMTPKAGFATSYRYTRMAERRFGRLAPTAGLRRRDEDRGTTGARPGLTDLSRPDAS